ncbi:MAG: response regulator [Sandaracinus sp.]|nr:response regulator [Myxococcales bacterium]MCB9616863.1 response regulator [Sandaracinus sp.]MCB9622320.1 response regulator [Sandaracinus sp.]MCB9634555.1 response regulator [Sandaracinus sp.]
MADRLSVLVVDDDEEQLDLVRRFLRLEGFDVEICSSPIGVSNLVRRMRPSVVLLDVNIPALSGPNLLQLLKKQVDGAATRFVLFSSEDTDKLRRLAGEFGADAYIQKGVDGGALARRLREVCAR